MTTRRREPSLHELVYATPLRPPGTPHDARLERFLADLDSIPPADIPAPGARVISQSGNDWSLEAVLATNVEAVKRLAQAELRRELEERQRESNRADEAEAELAAEREKSAKEAADRQRSRMRRVWDIALLFGGAGIAKFFDHLFK